MVAEITNQDLFTRSAKVKESDDLYVSTKIPEIREDRIKIEIDLDDEAVVIDKHRHLYPKQSRTVSEIRSGTGSHWLLSGGAVIFDEQGRIAVGLRDGNATEPFTYTNIAAGRCDRKFLDHCYEEIASEFLLCCKDKEGIWRQINFGEGTKPLYAARKSQPTIAKWKQHASNVPLVTEAIFPTTRCDLEGLTLLSIHWCQNGLLHHEELLQGFAVVDREHHTIEFRFPVEIDLSTYDSSEIFYGEGTGFALWMSFDQVRQMNQVSRSDGGRVITPFLEALVERFT